MEFKPDILPLWANEGEQPDTSLFTQGYKLHDVPFSKHLNFMFNKITSSFRYFATGKVHNRYGVFTSGQPVPLSEEGVSISASPHEIVYRGLNWYRLNRKDANTKEFTLSITYPNAFDNMVFARDRVGVYSVIVHISEPTDPTKANKITVTDVDSVWVSTEVMRLTPKSIGTDVQLVPYRITFKTAQGATKPTLTSHVKMKLIVSNDSNTNVGSFDMLRPVLYEGYSWFGNMDSIESQPSSTKEVFGFYDNTWNDPTKAPSYTNIPLGVSRIVTPTTGTYAGLPLSSKGILFNMAGYDSSSPGAQIVMLNQGADETPELYFRANSQKNKTRDYSKVMTSNALTDMLVDYATRTYVDSQLSKYITATTAESLFVTKTESDSWQKYKITDDTGGPLHVLNSISTEDVQAFTKSVVDAIGVNKNSMMSISIPGALIWGASVTTGLTPNTAGPILLYTNQGQGEPVYLNKSNLPLVGFVRGGAMTGSYYTLSGEVAGHVTGKTTGGLAYDDIAVSVKISIKVPVPTGAITVSGWDISDSTTQSGALNGIIKTITSNTLKTVDDLVNGVVLFEGYATTSSPNIVLKDNLSNFERLVVRYSDTVTSYVEVLHLPSIRTANVPISLQMQRILPSLTECYVYEMNISDGVGNVYTGKSLTVTACKRYALKAGTGAETTTMRVTKIVGLK